MQTTYASPDMRPPLPYPNGWFAACVAKEIKPGKVLTVPFMGRELVLYRTASGQARAITPYCPHLGTHLGHGGRVEGENLVCPFHGYVYGQDGRCLRTGTGQEPPDASLDCLPIREAHGLTFVWHHHARAAPEWELPIFDTTDFSRLGFAGFPVNGYLQDLVENTADSVHLQFLHNLAPSYSVTEQIPEGHMLKSHASDFFDRGIQLKICCYGLGIVVAEGGREDLGMVIRLMIVLAPRGSFRWDYLYTVNCRLLRPQIVPAAVRRAAASIVAASAIRWLGRQIVGDCPIWNHRIYLEHPMLTKEDMPIVIFRRWAKQFYPPTEATSVEAQPHAMSPTPKWSESSNRARAHAAAGQ